ncbi:MAG: class C sortase, partial [Promicromonosporaceae bacterium]|nr:class C sortase [Promicromonosporaceae bacterium]
MRKARLYTAIWTAILAVGAGLILFPHAACWINTYQQSGEVARHNQQLEALSAADLDHLFADAHRYNADLLAGRVGHTDYHHPDYLALLRVGDSSVMSSVTMPSINLTVPVHHGTTDEVLYRGAGHHYGSSLPVGGAGTHSVITAHSGLMRARLFTELERLDKGDVFFLVTAGRQLWYRVDQIVVVLPGDYHAYLAIEEDQDLVTLFTCTPTGLNTHRLMVRGHRIEAPQGGEITNYEATLEAG